MRSPFADRPEVIVPRSLKHLIAEDDPRSKENARRRRPRKTLTLRRSP
ncbi:hypothetical protein Acsp03_56770 [Actinomadura sp. NBRC 104412]|nr:hypothetical protein [Actinomadura sp. NBRC 104412]GLZ08211.1 hypothetical protein Acsp03_56770 [Actinomadura sp. NBRC 104412]